MPVQYIRLFFKHNNSFDVLQDNEILYTLRLHYIDFEFIITSNFEFFLKYICIQSVLDFKYSSVIQTLNDKIEFC